MAEIPGFAWIGIGGFVGLTSLFLGFIKPVDTSAFFKLMLFVGIGMVIYGLIKLKTRKKPEQMMHERRQQRIQERGPYQVNIDIDDYRKNPQLRQQAMEGESPKHPHTQHKTLSQKKTHHKSGDSKFCHQCGSPLLPKHKFCPICGTRV